MVRIVSDTSPLYSNAQAREAGFDVSPLSVTIAGKSYREFNEISADEFVSIIHQGHMPTSSQPAVGEVVSVYEQYPDDEIINIAMAEGLSGTYNGAVAAAGMCEHSENITVINTRTLCGPHRYMVEQAVEMAKAGASKDEILARLEKMMDSAKSYLMPADFDYLRRGGRLSPLVSYVGKAIKLVPMLTQTEDGKQLTISGVRRSFKQAIQAVAGMLSERGVDDSWHIYITHAAVPQQAEMAKSILMEKFPNAHYEIHLLSPAFITQGGPGCVAVQVVKG